MRPTSRVGLSYQSNLPVQSPICLLQNLSIQEMSGTKAFHCIPHTSSNSVRLPKTVGRFVKELQGSRDMTFIVVRKRYSDIVFKINKIFAPSRIELNLNMTALIPTRIELSLELVVFVPELTALIPRQSG